MFFSLVDSKKRGRIKEDIGETKLEENRIVQMMGRSYGHGFRLTERDDYFWVTFDHFCNKPFFYAFGVGVKIASSLN